MNKNKQSKEIENNGLCTLLGVVKSRPLMFVGFAALIIGNIVCYSTNDRLLHTPTNLVATVLIIANFYRKM